MAFARNLLGPYLSTSGGEDVPSSVLDGKVVGLYFSASWWVDESVIVSSLAMDTRAYPRAR